jgi:hypothetical protein
MKRYVPLPKLMFLIVFIPFVTSCEKSTEICPNPCDCICLYDLEYTIGPLEYGAYLLRVIEECADTMTVEFEFSATTQGSYCELRDGYPWDVK